MRNSNRVGNGIGNRLRRWRQVRGWGWDNVLWDRDRRLWQREVVGDVRNMVLDWGRWRLWHHLLGKVEGRPGGAGRWEEHGAGYPEAALGAES